MIEVLLTGLIMSLLVNVFLVPAYIEKVKQYEELKKVYLDFQKHHKAGEALVKKHKNFFGGK